MVAHQGRIYVGGGFGQDKAILCSVESYDPDTDKVKSKNLYKIVYQKSLSKKSESKIQGQNFMMKSNWKSVFLISFCSTSHSILIDPWIILWMNIRIYVKY